ncbi:YaaL family protein [Alicyclobacillus curvatus]|nr:YaaL family protein [Alicyclobacillus curvatus]
MSREKTEPVSSSLLHEDEIHDFIAALRKSKRELEIARQQFENVIDPRLIDHVVFRLGAAERHFSYLLQLARQLHISVAGIRWDWAEDAHR